MLLGTLALGLALGPTPCASWPAPFAEDPATPERCADAIVRCLSTSEPELSACRTETLADAVKPPRFDAWRERFGRRATRLGVASTTVGEALASMRYLPKVVALDRNQSEYSSTYYRYLGSTVSQARIDRGRDLLARYAALLADIRLRYGVPGDLLIALWGIESDHGEHAGSFPTLSTLATLAYEGRRRDFFAVELIEALRMIDAGDTSADSMTGSWAGAMGQIQFMPSTYRRFARDGDGDGRADIWGSVPDALESAASYLASAGWESGERWGWQVRLPEGFDLSQARLSIRRPVADWAKLGVVRADGESWGDNDELGSVVLPAGMDGPAFLVGPGFRAVLEWNRSLYYALSVGYLADRISGAAGPLPKAPPGDRPLPRARVVAMQRALAGLGFDAGEPDGMIGQRTREALQDYQQARGLPADAYPTPALIARIERELSGLRTALAPSQPASGAD